MTKEFLDYFTVIIYQLTLRDITEALFLLKKIPKLPVTLNGLLDRNQIFFVKVCSKLAKYEL
jgi:hypothetical protein